MSKWTLTDSRGATLTVERDGEARRYSSWDPAGDGVTIETNGTVRADIDELRRLFEAVTDRRMERVVEVPVQQPQVLS